MNTLIFSMYNNVKCWTSMSLPLLAIGLHDEGILWEIIKKKKKNEPTTIDKPCGKKDFYITFRVRIKNFEWHNNMVYKTFILIIYQN